MQKKQKRWMKSVIEASKAETPALPFDRGYRRTALRRDSAIAQRKAA